ncbi:DUF3068 domain-containing protein [Rhizohabitans arisaemae]|uniref:DUF3068 domain-containing protein n=1 Tax=Rhizohabitans arisaemae TaxID=2720610 RepID=UPI0024B2795A|nr:DUF3068 domain-containing protein [Rhizohabitans arisaemae]
MRRVNGIILIALGAFLAVLAPLVRFDIADKIISAPANQYAVIAFAAEKAKYFSVGDLKVVEGRLDITVTTRGDVAASTGDRVVWDEVTVVNDVTNDKPLISMTERRTAFNRFTGAAVNCCGAHVGKENVAIEGQTYLFPFGTEKRTYPVFNSIAGKALDAKFVGEENLKGLDTYKFEQVIDPTAIARPSVPAAVFGLKTPGDISAERVYEGVNTYWVEPVSGVIVRQEHRRDEVLGSTDGTYKVVAFEAVVDTESKSVDELIDRAQAAKSQIQLVRTTIPLIALILGILLLVAGALTLRGRTPTEQAEVAEDV